MSFAKAGLPCYEGIITLAILILRSVFIQISGMLARKIRWLVSEGERVNMAYRFGLIQCGPRGDICLPQSFQPAIRMDEMVFAGKTVLRSFEVNNGGES